MEAIAAFLDMGGYAGYVWPAYAVAAAVLAALAVLSVRRLRRNQRDVAVLEADRPRRRRPRCADEGASEGDGEA